jgi:phosphotransferase system enzyme I (PtsI)
MIEITGTGIGQGVAVGQVVRMADRLPEPADLPSRLDPEQESERARAALSLVSADLAKRAAAAGGVAEHVLEAQAMMAADPSLIDLVVTRLETGATAERAVFEAFAAYRAAGHRRTDAGAGAGRARPGASVRARRP